MANIFNASNFGKNPVTGGRPPSESSYVVNNIILRIDILWIVFDWLTLFLITNYKYIKDWNNENYIDNVI